MVVLLLFIIALPVILGLDRGGAMGGFLAECIKRRFVARL